MDIREHERERDRVSGNGDWERSEETTQSIPSIPLILMHPLSLSLGQVLCMRMMGWASRCVESLWVSGWVSEWVSEGTVNRWERWYAVGWVMSSLPFASLTHHPTSISHPSLSLLSFPYPNLLNRLEGTERQERDEKRKGIKGKRDREGIGEDTKRWVGLPHPFMSCLSYSFPFPLSISHVNDREIDGKGRNSHLFYLSFSSPFNLRASQIGRREETRRDTEMERDGKAFILGIIVSLPSLTLSLFPYPFPYLPSLQCNSRETKEWMGNYMEREGREIIRKERDGW